jgi:TonB family protein
MRRSGALFALISTALFAQDSREVMNQGIAAFQNGNYQRAVEFFQQAVAADPNGVNAHLYLGTAYMSLWIPPDNEATARSAETEFKRVLELDANNTVAIASLASLAYNQAAPLPAAEKLRNFDEAMDWYKRLAAIDPANKEAAYSMGVIAWAKSYPALMKARSGAGMRPEDPGPLPEPARGALKAQYSSTIEEGIASLNRALAIDPDYADAMAYLNLLIRERGDLRNTRDEWAADKAVADEWVQKNLAVKRAQAQRIPVEAAPPPPPPPPPGSAVPERVRVSGSDQENVILKRVDPVYPPLARQARISGQVRFVVTIGKDGAVLNIQLVSGHPLLVAAARDAVSQYVYKPQVVNGVPVEVITQVDVNFSLSN